MFVNIQNSDILIALAEAPFENQRHLAEKTGCSLGNVNKALRELRAEGLLSPEHRLTEQARELLARSAPKNAVILAAGIGMRMVPINALVPKALLEVRGEPLIERIIKQLHEVGVRDITVVVGFLKERFDYLIDEYGVKLAVNPAYAEKNNLSSLAMTEDQISNTYVLPSDLWFAENPFRRNELHSWYMVSDRLLEKGEVRLNRKQELVRLSEDEPGSAMIGLSYLTGADAAELRKRLRSMSGQSKYDGEFWEAALYRDGKMMIPARVFPAGKVTEINTFEQLRELDGHSGSLRSDALDVIARAIPCAPEEITDISILKKGMTNRSFLFHARGAKYIMRIPGEGTDQLIDRSHEAAVFRAIEGLGLCDAPVYINPENGYKITRFLDNVRECDPDSVEDLTRCMALLRAFHGMDLKVEHSFDIFGQIEFYEALWNGAPSAYRDYAKTKKNVLSLRPWIERQPRQWRLTHIDAVPDNFLFYRLPSETEERLQLTDWEYAGMQDPHVDIAMFCIYSMYDKPRIDRLIDIYFEGACAPAVRAKIYCYVAACGLLWSNWCEYKRMLGVEFGEYSLYQYRYGKDFYRYATELLTEIGEDWK